MELRFPSWKNTLRRLGLKSEPKPPHRLYPRLVFESLEQRALLAVVSLAATDNTATEAGTTSGVITVSVDTPSMMGYTVNLTISGTATYSAPPMSGLSLDYFAPASIFIPANATSATYSLTPYLDNLVEGDETAIFTLASGSGYTISTSQNTGTVTISDDPPVVITTTRTVSMAEGQLDFYNVTIGRSGGNLGASLTVELEKSGVATAGSDYWSGSGNGNLSITFSGNSSTASFVVQPTDDSLVEATESAVYTVQASDHNLVSQNADENKATLTIADNDVLTVSASGSPSEQGETTPTSGTYTITRPGSTATSLAVSYVMSGTATGSGTDYASLSGSVTIEAGQASVTVTLSPVDDAVNDANETAILTLSSTANYTASPTSGAATHTILDNEVWVTASGTPTETGPTSGTFTIYRNGPTTSELPVTYTMSGAGNGTDYNTLSGSIEIPAGQSSVNVVLAAINDSEREGNETATLTLSAPTGHTLVSGSSAATLTIDDNDEWTVGIAVAVGEWMAFEAGPVPVQMSVFRTGETDLTHDLTVQFAVSATNSTASPSDYTFSYQNFHIPANQFSISVTLTPIVDTLVENDETVIIELESNAAYIVGSEASTTIAIVSDNYSQVDLTPATNAVPVNSDDDNTNETPDKNDSGPVANENNLLPVALAFNYASAQFSGGTIALTVTSGGSHVRLWNSPTKDVELASGVSWAVGSSSIPATIYVEGLSTGTAELALTLSDATSTLVVEDECTIEVVDSTASITIEWVQDASEENAASGRALVTRFDDATTGLTVHYTVTTSGTVTSSDYVALSGVVVFAPSQITSPIDLTPVDDSVVEDPESLTLHLQTDVGYAALSGGDEATLAILDNEPIVYAFTTEPALAEGSATTSAITVHRTGSLSSSLTVSYTVNASVDDAATPGVDYSTLSGSVYFAANVADVEISISPLTDSTAEAAELIVLEFASNLSAGYSVAPDAAEAVVMITDDQPFVSIVAESGAPTELGLVPGAFTVSRSGSTSAALTVYYTVETTGTGVATPTSDYVALAGSIEIPADEESATISVVPVADSLVEGYERVHVTLTAATGYHLAPQTFDAELLIEDAAPVMSLSVVDALATEAPGNLAEFLFTRTGDISSSASAQYTIDTTDPSSAVSGVDYQALSGTVSFAANAATASVFVTPIDNSVANALRLVRLVLSSSTAYTVAANAVAGEAFIADDEPTVSIEAAQDTTSEEGVVNGKFTVSRSGGDMTSTLTVYLEIDAGSTATYGENADYVLSPVISPASNTVTIPAGMPSVDVLVVPKQDSLAEANETVKLKIKPSESGAYSIGTPSSDTVAILDDEPTISIAWQSDGMEYDPETGAPKAGKFLLLRSGSTGSTVSVDFTVTSTSEDKSAIRNTDYTILGLQAVFLPGESQVEVAVTPLADTLSEGPEFVEFTLTESDNYKIASPGKERLQIADKLNINLTGHSPGTMAAPGAAVPDRFEEDPWRLAPQVNDDADDPPPGDPTIQDNEDNVVRANDDDLVKLTLTRPGAIEGTVTFNVSDLSKVKVFGPAGQLVSLPLSVDLDDPSGPLADLVNQDVALFLEGLAPTENLKATLDYAHDEVTGHDEVHLNLLRVNLKFPDVTDPAEDDAGAAGQWVASNIGDSDADGVPNFADGFDKFNPAAGPPDLTQMASLSLKIEAPIDPANADVIFTYNAADPATMTANPYFAPGSGHLRLWDYTLVQNNSDPWRVGAVNAAVNKGYFIPAGVAIASTDLGFSESTNEIEIMVEGLHPSSGLGTDKISVVVRPRLSAIYPQASAGDSVNVTVALADLDVDSNNTDVPFGRPATTDPERSVEDQLEMKASEKGKLIPLNGRNRDQDWHKDFKDGFDLGNWHEAGEDKSAKFVPMEVTLSDAISASTATISFNYSASAPILAVNNSPLQGDIRLWTKSGEQARNGNSLGGGGDYLAPGVAYSASSLGFTSSVRTKTFYIEGIQAGQGANVIRLKVKPNGATGGGIALTDAVKYSVFELVVSGTIQYGLNTNERKPVREALVEAYSGMSPLSTLLGSTYTADDGTYSIPLPYAQGGYPDLRIYVTAKSRPADPDLPTKSSVTVNPYAGLHSYRVDFSPPFGGYPSPTLGPSTANFLIGYVNDNAEKAFWIFDAGITASRMQSRLPGSSTVRAPFMFPIPEAFDFTEISGNTGLIHIQAKQYSDWDTIIHEYGHHIQIINGFWVFTAPFLGHHVGINNRTYQPKAPHSKVLQLGFSEGFANFFSMLAQKEVGVPTPEEVDDYVASTIAGDDKLYTYDVEAADASGRGEDEELSVMRILWDLYDPANENPVDRVELGYGRLFELLNFHDITTLDELWDVLGEDCEYDPKTMIDYGAIFQAHNVSPKIVGMKIANPTGAGLIPLPGNSLAGQTGVPSFVWKIPSGSDDTNLLSNFGIRIFDEDYQPIFDTGLLVKRPDKGTMDITEIPAASDQVTWTPLKAFWDCFGLTSDKKYHWIVYGIDTKFSSLSLPFATTTTGPYWSDQLEFTR